jgi:translation initiation factor RLI1
MQTRFLPDKRIAEETFDKLGLKPFVASLGVAVATADAPYVFGVFGDWGVGKTSALTLLEAKLEQDLSAKRSYDVPIWINVWKFENEANMGA